MSRSSPDTPLSDRLGSTHAGRASSRGLGSRSGSWASLTPDSPGAAAAGVAGPGMAHADEALSCTASLSGSISERSINLCFAGGHSSPLMHAAGGGMADAAYRLRTAQEGSAECAAGTAGASVVLEDHQSKASAAHHAGSKRTLWFSGQPVPPALNALEAHFPACISLVCSGWQLCLAF